MSRGPHPGRTLAGAIPIAQLRGTVHVVRRAHESQYDLVIAATVPVAFIRVKYADRILVSLQDIEARHRDAIAGLRAMVSAENISRELWLRSRHGTWRFFRIETTGLVEISRDGRPLDIPGKNPSAPLSGRGM